MDKNKQWIDNLRRQAQGYERKAPEGLLGDIRKEMARRGVMTASSLPAPKDRGEHGSTDCSMLPRRQSLRLCSSLPISRRMPRSRLLMSLRRRGLVIIRLKRQYRVLAMGRRLYHLT